MTELTAQLAQQDDPEFLYKDWFFGTPEIVAEKIYRMTQYVGVTYLNCTCNLGQIPHPFLRGAPRRAGERVRRPRAYPRALPDALNAANNLADDPASTTTDCGLTDGSVVGDWRLPNVKELQSLIHFGFFNPALSNAAGTAKWTEGNAFSGVQSFDYWSSATNVDNPDRAWVVAIPSVTSWCVRAVRSWSSAPTLSQAAPRSPSGAPEGKTQTCSPSGVGRFDVMPAVLFTTRQ